MMMRWYVRRVLAVILAAVLLVGFIPENAYALSFWEQESYYRHVAVHTRGD